MGKNIERRQFLRIAAGAAIATGASAALVGCGTGGGKGGSSGSDSEQVLGWTEINFEHDVDVCVVGAGGSGLPAAYNAATAGCNTLCIEKQSTYGGDAANSANTWWVPYASVTADLRPGEESPLQDQIDSVDKSYEPGTELNALNKKWYEYVDKWMSILTYDMNAQWQESVPCVYKGCYWPEGGIGQGQKFWANVQQHVESAGVKFVYNMKADTFIVNAEGNVVGLRCYDTANERWVDIKSKAFILATGGFAANQDMVAEYYPELVTVGCVTTEAMGEGIQLGQSVGGSLLGMSGEVNCNPHLECIHVSQSIGRSISILPNGHRFHNESRVHMGPTNCIAAGFWEWWVIFDDDILNGPSALNVEKTEQYRVTGNTVEELAAAMNMPASVVQIGFDEYNAVCDAGVDEAFGRTFKLEKLEPPYYAMKLSPRRYKTAGGLRVDVSGQVLNESGDPVAGIFACGCTGGTTDIPPAGASGLIAGEGAAAYVKSLS
ncbi:FAD-dependent oxidoreductase [Eggerthella sp. YY7918]|uniref:FAD-dependent oxidoreductase n=1 Tax=Eggerthella sp. (strain YY7918) TaxID=502558 RepID=UPI001E5CE62B|nr:FAD-dependent oxidoreductase [Eggerthella sp. YY7918]